MVKENTMKQTEIGLLPEDWEIIELSEIGTFKNGINKGAEDFGFGSPFINLMDVFGKNVISSNSSFGLVNSNSSEKEMYNVKCGDVIFIRSSVKPSGVGKTVLIQNDLKDTVYSGFLIRYRNNTLSDNFKRYCFDAEYFRNNVIAGSTVSANTNINQDTLKSLKLAFPKSLSEQEAIAEALSDADAWIESLEQLIAKKHLIKQGAMQELLTPKEDWEVKKLGEVCEIKKGQMITSSVKVDGNIPVIAGGKTPAYFHNKANRTGKTITVSASGASAGYVGFHNYPIFASDCSTIIENEKYCIEFIYYFLSRNQEVIYSYQTGGAQPHIHPKDIEPMVFGIPSLTEQTRIATILSDMDAELEALEAQLGKARKVKQGMMQELLTGRVRLI